MLWTFIVFAYLLEAKRESTGVLRVTITIRRKSIPKSFTLPPTNNFTPIILNFAKINRSSEPHFRRYERSIIRILKKWKAKSVSKRRRRKDYKT